MLFNFNYLNYDIFFTFHTLKLSYTFLCLYVLGYTIFFKCNLTHTLTVNVNNTFVHIRVHDSNILRN